MYRFSSILVQQMTKHCNHMWINKKQHMFRALFYPSEVKFFTKKVRASVTNSMSANSLDCYILTPQLFPPLLFLSSKYLPVINHLLFVKHFWRLTASGSLTLVEKWYFHNHYNSYIWYNVLITWRMNMTICVQNNFCRTAKSGFTFLKT